MNLKNQFLKAKTGSHLQTTKMKKNKIIKIQNHPTAKEEVMDRKNPTRQMIVQMRTQQPKGMKQTINQMTILNKKARRKIKKESAKGEIIKKMLKKVPTLLMIPTHNQTQLMMLPKRERDNQIQLVAELLT